MPCTFLIPAALRGALVSLRMPFELWRHTELHGVCAVIAGASEADDDRTRRGGYGHIFFHRKAASAFRMVLGVIPFEVDARKLFSLLIVCDGVVFL